MPIFLNLILLFLCLNWLHKSKKSSPTILGVVFTFIGGTFISFILSLILENGYLDGALHLIAAGGSAVIFFLMATTLILIQLQELDSTKKLGKILITSIVLIVPLFIYLLISNMNFKIGG